MSPLIYNVVKNVKFEIGSISGIAFIFIVLLLQ